ncbi:DNA-binding response regulator [Paractinoplanes abujensis]|uniref:DNA-binding NarL/FixJ family response regulator n=1 Tax=Paractinoplanes abujensis TaxID=882441 RepID=A0A7W7G6Y8_9ACTN|nr:response regulator transcription factor [Actinoplanes abujensis]MBB4697900.1 DNA-binding NarL/FixJ family response regulator [Actinoplanes abujensis]GID19616.1 DNA-binding response regulator [Actinoplanes abujensis]
MIRVLLVDDQQLIRAGLRMLCDAEPDLEVVGEAGNGREAITLAARLAPDVIVMDLRMPGVDGISATSRVLAERPATRVLVLTTFGDDDHLYPALTAGACGFLLKDAPPAELLDGIRRAAAGDSPFSRDVLQRLVRRATDAGAERRRGPVEGLTSREQDVLDLVGEGLSNTEIAERLHIGITTVKTHITALMTKTSSPNRVRLALLAHRDRP